MVGVLELVERKGRRPEVTEERLLDLRCLRVSVPVRPGLREARIGRLVDKGAGALARAGVRRVLTAADFPWWERLRQNGLRPVETEQFCQAMALPLTLAALERRGIPPDRASVTLWGPASGRALLRAAEGLCPRVRRLSVDVPGEGEELAAWLWREFGAAMVRPEAGGRADVVIRFGPGGPEGAQVLALHGPQPDLGGLRLLPPPGAEAPPLDGMAVLALLWETGRLDLRKIRIVST